MMPPPRTILAAIADGRWVLIAGHSEGESLMRFPMLIFTLAVCFSFAWAQEDKTAPVAQDAALFTAIVTTEAGKPVAGAQVYLIEGTHNTPISRSWRDADNAGSIELRAADLIDDALDEGGDTFTLVTRAPGMAWNVQSVQLPRVGGADDPVQVTLHAGRSIDITLQVPPDARMVIPDDRAPVSFAEATAFPAWITPVLRFKTDTGGKGAM